MIAHTPITPQLQYIHATQEGQAAGIHGERIEYSIFHPTHSESGMYLLIDPGTGHQKRHLQSVDWIDPLCAAGVSVVTLSYRGHGESTCGDRELAALHIEDYVQDNFTVMRQLGLHPSQIVISGHSLGAEVAQQTATQEALSRAGFGRAAAFAGIVLLAGVASSVWQSLALRSMPAFFLQHPRACLGARRNPSAIFATPDLARTFLFSNETPQGIVRTCCDLIGAESPMAAAEVTQGRPLRPLAAQRVLFVLGSEDKLVPVWAVQRSVRLYQKLGHHTAMVLLSGTPHNLMLDGQTRQASNMIAQFVTSCKH